MSATVCAKLAGPFAGLLAVLCAVCGSQVPANEQERPTDEALAPRTKIGCWLLPRKQESQLCGFQPEHPRGDRLHDVTNLV